MRGRLAICFSVLAVMAVMVPAPAVQGASDTCRVRNVTQGTHGSSFKKMVRAAVNGDRLTVRGVCEGGALIKADITISGTGPDDPRPVLTGLDRHRVLRIARGARVVLRHLTIQHGRSVGDDGSEGAGGGVLNEGRLTVRNSIIRRNVAGMIGGGIESVPRPCGSRSTCPIARLNLTDTLVTRNRALWGSGIGSHDVYEGGSGHLTMRDTVVRGNLASRSGSAIVLGSDALIERSIVARNEGTGIFIFGSTVIRDASVRGNEAGGIYIEFDDELSAGRLVLVDSSVASSTSPRGGGGILNVGGTVILRGSRITANTAAGQGGGIWNGPESICGCPGRVTLDRASSVTGNSAAEEGGGIVNHGGDVTVARASTITGNVSGREGGGIWNGDDPEDDRSGRVILKDTSSVTDNTPDDCVGTDAC